MNNAKLLASVLLLSPAVRGYAQSPSETRNAPTTASVYAQNDITLGLAAGPGTSFSTTTVGFEAVIRKPAAVGGRWSAPLTWTDYVRPVADGGDGATKGLVGIHTHVLPNGKVLSWEGHNDDNHLPGGMTMTHAYEWNPSPAADPLVYNNYDNSQGNLFCSGHTLLKDGRLLVAGGHYSAGLVDRTKPSVNNINNKDYIPPSTGDVDSYIGLRDANTFNFLGNTIPGSTNYVWQQQPSMQYRRWYPTVTTLADGNALVTAGQKYGSPVITGGGPIHADIPELYDADTNTWQPLSNASRVLPLYPLMFLAPDGQVFNAGPNSDTKFLNPNTYAIGSTVAQTWGSATYNAHYGLTRGYGTAVMYLPGKIFLVGGAGLAGVTNTAELIDITTLGVARFLPAASMGVARTHANATILPDGTVLMTGGCSRNLNNETDAVLIPELWTPPTSSSPKGTWARMSEMAVPRLYHSTAVLLPDATVLTTGGGQGAGFPEHHDYQIFTPPYLCKGLPRPQIALAPAAVAYGQTFTVASPDAANIARATWVRLSSVTHSFNMNQRFMDLNPIYNTAQAGQLTITAPTNANLCPPGHYMLFLIDNNGTPSLASIMAINTTSCLNTLSFATPSVVSDNGCDKTIRLTVSGGNSGNYSWIVNGTVNGTSIGPSINLDVNAYSSTLQVRVEQSATCGASTTFTTYFPNCTYTSRPANNKP